MSMCRVSGDELRPEPNGDTAEAAWTPIAAVARLRRLSLVSLGIAQTFPRPATWSQCKWHVEPVQVGSLIED